MRNAFKIAVVKLVATPPSDGRVILKRILKKLTNRKIKIKPMAAFYPAGSGTFGFHETKEVHLCGIDLRPSAVAIFLS
jgi:hypothetical protein